MAAHRITDGCAGSSDGLSITVRAGLALLQLLVVEVLATTETQQSFTICNSKTPESP